jgi:hypothetical protein
MASDLELRLAGSANADDIHGAFPAAGIGDEQSLSMSEFTAVSKLA